MDQPRGRVTKDGIRIHEPGDFAGMHDAGRLAARILDDIAAHIHPGQTTGEIDRRITAMIEDAGAKSATIGYRGYQHASCISVNHVVCHGIPGSKIPKWKNDPASRSDDTLRDGDILNIDVTVIVDGWYGDTSRMYVAGLPKPYAERLIQVTHDALMKGIEAVRPGNTFGDIGYAIQSHVEAHRMSVVRDFCGHGLGRVFHAPPNVLHYAPFNHVDEAGRKYAAPRRRDGALDLERKREVADPTPVLEEGMFFTIEPMVNLGRADTRVLGDDWTAITRDKSLSAQFEHSVGVTADGHEIFTLSPAGLFHPTYG